MTMDGMDSIGHLSVQPKPCAFTFAQLQLNRGGTLIPEETALTFHRSKEFELEELLEKSILETAAKASNNAIEKAIFAPQPSPKAREISESVHHGHLPKLAPCIERDPLPTLDCFLSKRYQPRSLKETSLERCKVEAMLFVAQEAPLLFKLQIATPCRAVRSGLEDLQSWILQKTLRNPKELEVDPVQNTSSSLGSISDLFHEVTALNSSQRGVSQMLQQYSDRNLKVGAPVALSDRLEAMSKHRCFAPIEGLSTKELKVFLLSDKKRNQTEVSTAAAMHCIRSLQALISAGAKEALVESYLTYWLSKASAWLQEREQQKIESLLSSLSKTCYVVVNEDSLCDKDQTLFNLVAVLGENRIGIIERCLDLVSIVFDAHTAGILSPAVLTQDWVKQVVDGLGRQAVQRYSLVYIFIPLVAENFYFARLLGLLTARMSGHVHVAVRMTSNLPGLIISLTRHSIWYKQLDWITASGRLDTFELNTKAEDTHTLQSERFLACFPSINVVLARNIIAAYGTLGRFLTHDDSQLAVGEVHEEQLKSIHMAMNFDVNPARTKALRKRKLGLAAAPNAKNPKQLTLSWKS